MKKARLGFIGCGAFIQNSHLPNAARSDRIEIRALCDLNAATLSALQEQYHPAYVTGDHRALLADPDIDLVVIGTKQDTHAALAIQALEADKWVYCEKPLFEEAGDAAKILAAARKTRGRLAVGHNRRFAPAVRKARELLMRQSGPLFFTYRVVALDIRKNRPGDYYADRPRILFEGCHMLDLANYLVQGRPAAVLASGDPLGDSYTIIEYADGSRFCLHLGSCGSPLLAKEHMELFRGTASITLTDFFDLRIRGIPGEHDLLFTDEGTLAAEAAKKGADAVETLMAEVTRRLLQHGRIQVQEGWDKVPVERVQRVGCAFDPDQALTQWGLRDPLRSVDISRIGAVDKGHSQALEHFARCLLTGDEPQNAGIQDGMITFATAQAVIESLQTGCRTVVVHGDVGVLAPAGGE